MHNLKLNTPYFKGIYKRVLVAIFTTFFTVLKANNETYYYDLWQSGILHSFQEKEINTTINTSVFDSDYNSKKIDRFCKEYKKSKKSCIWKYIYKDNRYIFFSQCKNSAKNKKYEIFQDLSVELIPKVKDSKKPINIKKLSSQSVCCYNRNCYYLTIWH